jgi:glycosyltransferase involved in cell wall biosynthesis
VTTDVAGAKELVLDTVTGFVRPQGDIQGLAQAILSLAKDARLRQRMGQAGRRRIEQEFSFSGRLHCVEALYAEILGLEPNTISSG